MTLKFLSSAILTLKFSHREIGQGMERVEQLKNVKIKEYKIYLIVSFRYSDIS